MFPSRSSGGEERDDGRDRSPIPSGELASEPTTLALESQAATSPGPAGWTAARRSCLSLQKSGTRKQAERRAREVPDCATRQSPPVNPQQVRGLGGRRESSTNRLAISLLSSVPRTEYLPRSCSSAAWRVCTHPASFSCAWRRCPNHCGLSIEHHAWLARGQTRRTRNHGERIMIAALGWSEGRESRCSELPAALSSAPLRPAPYELEIVDPRTEPPVRMARVLARSSFWDWLMLGSQPTAAPES